MYKVIKAFADLQDDCREYVEGDVYPREGLEPSPERIEVLSSSANKQGVPLIEPVEEIEPVEVKEEPVTEKRKSRSKK